MLNCDCDIKYEELSAYSCGDLDVSRHGELRAHLAKCEQCRKRHDALLRADETLERLRPMPVPASSILAARRVLTEDRQQSSAPEIMTLPDTARFLRISENQLGEILEELPAFELAGEIRVRRTRLVEWIELREQHHQRR